ncbi:MAG: response regulator transcription factor NblR [Geitlerinemataceae cyanobacterium]
MTPDTTQSPPACASVLIVEPDTALAQKIARDLEEAGYTPAIVSAADRALERIEDSAPGLVVIDRRLPEEGGLQLCRTLRGQSRHLPVLMLSIADTLQDRIACLDCGADDYVMQPYRSHDFLKMVEFYLEVDRQDNQQLRFSDLILDLNSRQATRSGRTIELTMKEFELLKFLMQHPREVMPREQILENVWGYEFMGESNVIEVYVRYLRLKLEEGDAKRVIQTVRGVGYVLRDA